MEFEVWLDEWMCDPSDEKAGCGFVALFSTERQVKQAKDDLTPCPNCGLRRQFGPTGKKVAFQDARASG